MITSKNISNLLESYVYSKKVRGGALTIYENPDRSDILSALKDSYEKSDDIRFIADFSSKKVYIFNGMLGIHEDGLRLLSMGGETGNYNNPNRILGDAIFWNGMAGVYKSVAIESHLEIVKYSHNSSEVESAKKYLDEILNKNWTWVDKYLRYTNLYIKNKLKEYQQLLIKFNEK